ncbi:MAG: methionyl-tRNA formyltransferase [Candidatus Cryptobacteroides sp.]
MGQLKKTRIVYMGTPEFAVGPLDALISKGHNVVGVVTVADKASGRGLKVNESAVKKYAVAHGIPVLQPVSLKDPAFLEQLRAWKADIFVVVAFRMLPKEVWEMPKSGTFNLHAALLPQYRGAAPINWAVINGENVTGVTTFMIDEGIDTGNIMMREQIKIAETDTAGDIHDKLMEIGSEVVVETVEAIMDKNVELRLQKSFIQGSEVLKPAPKLTRELCHIDWNGSVKDIYNLIRGLSPYPAAFTELVKDGKTTQMKIFRTEKVTGEAYNEMLAGCGATGACPGQLLSDGKSFLAVTVADGAISIKELQIAGKKRMDVADFLLGFRDPQSYSLSKGTSSEFTGKYTKQNG